MTLQRRQLWSVLTAIACGLGILCSACGGGSGMSPISGNDGSASSGYVSSDQTSAAFIQWTRTGTSVSGQLQEADLDSNQSFQPANEPFTGVISGSRVTLNFDLGVTVTGSLSGNTLTLTVPLADGTLSSPVFHPGSVAEYNADVVKLQSQAAHVAAARAAIRATSEAGQVAAAQTKVAAATAAANATATADHVDYDVNTLVDQVQSGHNDASNLNEELTSLANDANVSARDLATTQSDASKTEGEARAGDSHAEVCVDAAGVVNDAVGVRNDAVGAQNDLSSMRGAIAGTRQGLAYLTNDIGYVLREIPDYSQAGDDQAFLAELTAKVASTVTQTNNYIDQVNQNVANAYAAADGAFAVGNCGSGPAAPQPIGHVN